MASTDKTAQITGSLLVTPSSSPTPVENISINIITGTFTVIQTLVFTLAAAASRTITFSSLGIAADAHLMYITARDILTGLPRSIEITFTAPGGAQGGISAVNPSALVASDLIMAAYDLQDLTALDIQAQNTGNDTEVTLILGGS